MGKIKGFLFAVRHREILMTDLGSKQYGLFRLVTIYISENLCFSQKKNVILQ